MATITEVVQKWDAGEPIQAIEMGGLGPGYEQAIQILIVELLRDNDGKPLPDPESDEAKTWGDDTVNRVNGWPGCGFSGAQVGAARGVAFRMLSQGYEATLDEMREHDKDRLILASRTWPREPADA